MKGFCVVISVVAALLLFGVWRVHAITDAIRKDDPTLAYFDGLTQSVTIKREDALPRLKKDGYVCVEDAPTSFMCLKRGFIADPLPVPMSLVNYTIVTYVSFYKDDAQLWADIAWRFD